MQKYGQIAIEALTPYERNARTHSEAQVEKIANSIREFGFLNPVLIDSKNMIIAGHGRVLAAKKLGYKEVPCLRVEDLTETQIRAYILADNKLAEEAGWDEVKTVLRRFYNENKTITTVIHEAKPARSDLHPTMKPVALIERQIENSSKEGDIVLDLFGGSGTTLIACENKHRKCRMMEYDERYADVIIKRWEEHTGRKAVKLDGND